MHTRNPRILFATTLALLPFAALFPASQAYALAPDDDVAIEARGRADTDGLLPQPALSSLTQTEKTTPFGRSVVSVADAQPGLFDYSASADIGTLELKVTGQLVNSGATQMFGQGVPLLSAVAEARDIITLSTSNTNPFPVTLEMVVDGELITGANSSASSNSLIILSAPGQISVSDSALYGAGPVQDTLTVTRTVSGPLITLELQTFLSYNVFSVAPGESASGQLGNTALIKLILPEDVTIVDSASGTFGVPIPVPEPATGALWVAGLMLVAGLVRRKRSG